MSGIYIHIPFCKQACHYCDFHFSTSLNKKAKMIKAIAQELVLRKGELENEKIETIYFGGGTPSILETAEIDFLITSIYENYLVSETPEITLEANPDDLTEQRIIELATTKINRLSIGIQSFFDADLKMMNRAHSSEEAKKSLDFAAHYFDDITIDLIYGIPGMSMEAWEKNIEIALSSKITHLSSYALTVEPKTALQKLIQTGKIRKPTDELAQEHFSTLVEIMEENGFIHYELSNFGKENYFSKNNSAYWLGKKYMGIGPSAHSFNGVSRSWNISNNSLYIQSIEVNQLPNEVEILTPTDRYNEYVMTGLRTIWGVSLDKITSDFGQKYTDYFSKEVQKFLIEDLVSIQEGIAKPTKKGKFLTDGIASDLFYLNLE